MTASPTAAQQTDDATPYVNEWFAVDYRVTFENMTAVSIDATFRVHEATLPSYGVVTADEIRSTSDGEIDSPAASALLTVVQNTARTLIDDIFPNQTTSELVLHEPVIDPSSLDPAINNDPPAGDMYQPAVVVDQTATLELNAYSFGLGMYPVQELDDLLIGVLDMGARVNKSFNTTVYAGHEYNITMQCPPGVEFARFLGGELVAANRSHVHIDNRAGTTLVRHRLDAAFRASSAHPYTDEEIGINGVINLPTFSSLNLSLRTGLEVVGITGQQNASWRDHIYNLNFLPADGLRLLHANGLLELDDINEEIDPELEKIRNHLQESLKVQSPLEFELVWNLPTLIGTTPLYTLPTLRSTPPVEVTLVTQVGNVELVEDLSSTGIEGFLNAGAMAHLDFEPPETSYDDAYDIIFPPWVRLEALSSDVSFVGSGANGRVTYHWAALGTFSGRVRSISDSATQAQAYTANKCTADATIDITDLQIESLSSYKATVTLEFEAHLYHIDTELEIFGGVSDAIPADVIFRFVNADAIRLALDEGLVTTADLDAIKENVTARITDVEQLGDLEVDVAFVDATLEGYQVAAMTNERPVRLTISAHGQIDLGALSTEQALRTTNQVIYKPDPIPLRDLFRSIEGWELDYELILPYGIEIVSVDGVEAEQYHTGERGDGRHYITVTVTDELSEHAQMTVGLSILFFLQGLWPWLVLIIVLIVAAVTFRILRRRKKKQLRRLEKEAEAEVGSEGGTASAPYGGPDRHPAPPTESAAYDPASFLPDRRVHNSPAPQQQPGSLPGPGPTGEPGLPPPPAGGAQLAPPSRPSQQYPQHPQHPPQAPSGPQPGVQAPAPKPPASKPEFEGLEDGENEEEWLS